VGDEVLLPASEGRKDTRGMVLISRSEARAYRFRAARTAGVSVFEAAIWEESQLSPWGGRSGDDEVLLVFCEECGVVCG